MDKGFEEAMLHVLSFGGDTDTIGCMAGSILGAYWGYSAIPERWRQLCEGTYHLVSVHGEKGTGNGC